MSVFTLDRNLLYMTPTEFDELLRRYLQETCTPKEKKFVEDWFANMTGKNKEILKDEEKMSVRDKLWEKVNVGTEHPNQTSRKVRRLRYWNVTAIAASVSIIAFAAFIFLLYENQTVKHSEVVAFSNKTIVVEALHETRKFTLQDGSSVTLEPGSQLQYPEAFDTTRVVILTGEAFFEVTRDEKHPFLVRSNEIVTHVLGTSFRVKAYPDAKEIVVAVKTGKVSVSDSGSNVVKTVLTPNQQVVYHRSTRNLQRALVTKPEVVKKDSSLKMHYTNASVTAVFEALSNAYGVSMQYDEERLSGCTVTTDLTEEGLFERLEVICHAINATYSVKDTMIVIEGNGCD